MYLVADCRKKKNRLLASNVDDVAPSTSVLIPRLNVVYEGGPTRTLQERRRRLIVGKSVTESESRERRGGGGGGRWWYETLAVKEGDR